MKTQLILFLSFVISLLLSCSNSKEKYNSDLADKMKLEVNYINNQMPTMDGETSKYISFMVFPENGTFDENWKTISLIATSGDLEVQVLKFDNNEFEAKGEKVYRNNARMGLSELDSIIDVKVILVNESKEQIQLIQSNIKEEIVY